jgi:RNA polymerase sigma-70 factor (ECF subfamily)
MNDAPATNAERFLELLRPIERELETYARRVAWDANEAPDALQNAVLRAFRAFDRYHEDASFRAWMFKILTNEVHALNRRRGRINRHELLLEPEALDALGALEQQAEYTDWLLSPEALAEALDQDIVTALQRLTEMERTVLLLRSIRRFRYREIAETLDIPLGSVMGNLSRARRKMREAILRSRRRSQL